MISNSKIMEMGRKSLKGSRLKAAGITVIGNVIGIAIVFAIYFILVNFKEPNVISLENTIIDHGCRGWRALSVASRVRG